jgi:GNAT superfamily N-acetyltransferase
VDREPVLLKASKRIPVTPVASLFKRARFNDWFTRSDVEWYLRKALHVVSAWAGKRCVGIVVLTGDGRIDVSVDVLVVDPSWQGKGIGSRLMERILARIERLKPYHVRIEVFERRTERFYARFGFVRNKGTWLLEYAPNAKRLRRLVRAARARTGK